MLRCASQTVGGRNPGKEAAMIIAKIFNNNIISTLSEEYEEIIVTGSGIGFQKKVGQDIDCSRIEKTYEIKDESRNKLYRMLMDTPESFIVVAQEIQEKASMQLGIEIDMKAFFGLVDHIYYAVERKKNQIEIPNLMLLEIICLYPEELKIGKWAIDIIEEQIGTRLSEHEAGYLAMHFVNATLGENKESIMKLFMFSSGIISIIEEEFGYDLKKDEASLARLLSHLRFLGQRILTDRVNSSDDLEDFYDLLMRKDRKFKPTMRRITTFVKKNYHYDLTRQECVYIMVHINKLAGLQG